MAKERERFVPSINIKFDLGKDEYVDRYLPTPSHAEPILGIVNGLTNKGAKAHIIVGPYGSGKSLLGTLIANISTKSIASSALKRLYQRFDQVSPDITKLLKELDKHPVRYIPVILEGNIGNFRNSLLASIQRALDKYNVEIDVPGVAADIIHRIENWQKDFPETFIKLQRLVAEHWDWNVWLYQIENYDPKAISWFSEVYPQLTSGSPFQFSNLGDVSTQLEFVLSALKNKKMGLFVVHDEFGRYLQALGLTQIHETMQDLQEVSELVNHSDFENMVLTLITHRNLRQYSSRFNEDLQKEFQRIEKRFISYNVESDQATFIRLASHITIKYRKNWNGPEKEVSQGLAKFQMFPELTDYEVANLVASGSYPVHPVSFLALPRLANVVAQNERTLFTLLESDEPGGLKKHNRYSNDWYTIDNLFDYFEPSFEAYEVDSAVKDNYLLYKRSLHRLLPSDETECYLKIIKLLAVWEIGNLKTKILPTTDLIAFAFGWDEPLTIKYLKELAQQKIVRYLNDLERWTLYDGSIVDVEKEIKNQMNSFSLSNREKMFVLDGLLERSFFLPNEYNDKKSMTRFAVARTIHDEEIGNNGVILGELLQASESDLAIYLVVVENANNLDAAYEKAINLSKDQEQMLFVVPSVEFDLLDNKIRQLKAIGLLEQDKQFISQDKFLADEISFIKREVIYGLRQILKGFTQFINPYKWIYSGEMLQVSSERGLSKHLSRIANEIYPSTPIVKNEAFNRRHVSKVQKKNAINLIDQIIEAIYTGKTEIEISGFGPDYLIYATVLKNNGVRLLQSEIQNEFLFTLREDIRTVLDKGTGSVGDLVNIFTNKPYGIRYPVIPVLFISLLSGEWKHMMFFRNNMFVSSLDGELLWNILENPKNYTFSYQEPNEKDLKLAALIQDVFIDLLDASDFSLQLSLQLCRTLMRWFMSLPRFSRSTNQQTAVSNRFRELIKLTEVRPQEALDELYSLTDNGTNKDLLVKLRKENEDFMEIHKHSLKERILKIAQFAHYEELKSWADEQQGIIQHKSKLISALVSSTENNWIEIISERLVGVPRESWSDATDVLFETELTNELVINNQNDYDEHYTELRTEEGLILIPKIELSKKSQLIYENVKETLQYTGRTVSKEEIRVVLWKLLREASSIQELPLDICDSEGAK